MRRRLYAYTGLVLAAFLFGATFVAVKDAIETVAPLSFVGWRFLLGAAFLLLLARPRGGNVWRDGLLAGLALFAGYAFQTEGLARTSAANSGLITGLFVVITPLLAAVFHREPLRGRVVAGTVVAFVGLALLTIGDTYDPASGDVLTIGAAVSFAAHIVVLARVAPRHPVIPLTAIQLLVTGVLALAGAIMFGDLELPGTKNLAALVFTALAVSGGAYLLQVWAQGIVGAAPTAVVLALEPAFALGTAVVLVDERLTGRGWIGAALILAGIFAVVTIEGEELPAAEAVTPAH